jgi:hypothetical protein
MGAFSNGSICICEDFLNVFRANSIGQVCCKVLLESMNEVDLSLFRRTGVPRTSRHPPPPSFPCMPLRGHDKCTSSTPRRPTLHSLHHTQGSICQSGDEDATIASTLESAEDA